MPHLLALMLLTGTPQAPAWTHPLAASLPRADWAVRGRNTGALYRWAISHDVPIRTWAFTYYHPDERGGTGGGWSTADGGGFRPDCLAAALRHYGFWRGHELWVQYHGRVVVGDNGPGWSGRYRFDLPGPSAAFVDDFDAHEGVTQRRAIVIWCPRPETCECDWARAWRQAHTTRYAVVQP